jgi:VWFA-related protein
VDARAVYLTVSARDVATGRYVTDLRQSDFAVYENGRPQKIFYFEGAPAAVPDTERVPVRMSLLLDMSGSIKQRIPDIRDAALIVIRSLKSGPRLGPEDDDLARIMMFHDRSIMTQDFTHHRLTLEKATDSIPEDGGGTKLYTSLYVQLREMESLGRADGQRYRNVIVVLSDGIDTASLHTDDEIIEVARSSRVAVYTILLARYHNPRRRRRVEQVRSNEELVAENFMHRLAAVTGGTAYVPSRIKRLKDVYQNIANEVAMQYRIGYQPIVPPDGQVRHISVHTSERPNILLQHRPSYRAVR